MASQLEPAPAPEPYLYNHPSPSPTPSSSRRHHNHSQSHSHSHSNHNNHQDATDTTSTTNSTPSSSSRRHHHHHHHHHHSTNHTSHSHRTPSSSSSSTSSSSTTRPRSSSVNSERSSRRHSKHSHSHHHYNNNTTYHAHHPRPGGMPLVSTSAKTTPMHDDTDAGRLIPANGPPALAIDYLGGGWNNEDDIAASWKFMTKQKNDLINGLRLENASWRNWAKQRHNLKTISPKSLNWLKDSDTTWLYGPLYKAAIDEFDRSRFGAQTVAAAGESVSIPTTPTRHISDPILPTDLASAISTSTSSSSSTSTASTTSTTTGAGARGKMAGGLKNGPLKPVLKHKTASELFKADTLFHVQSDMRLNRRIDPINKARESAVFKQHRQPKLRFNDSVEQCVSIDTDVISEEDEDMGGYGSDSNNNSSTSGGSGSSSRSSENNNEKDDEDARVGLNGRHEDEDGGLLMRISVRRPPRSIVRIDSTTLKAASLHGMNENLEDPEDATTTEDEDDEGLFDEPIYLGNPYTGSGTAYVGSRQDAPYEAALDDVSYTRPLPPSPTVGSTVSNESSSSSTVFYSASSTTPNSSNSGSNASSIHGGIEVHQQQTPAFVVTQTSRPISSLLPPTGASTPLMDQTTTLTTPAPSAARTALASALEAEKAMAANGGMQQRATDLVANVKGLVNWASSFVFNSSTF